MTNMTMDEHEDCDRQLCEAEDKIIELNERIKKLEAVMQRCIDAMKGSNCLEEQWLISALKSDT